MKKKLLTLFIAIASFALAFGQSLVTTEPAAITAPGTDDSYTEYQQGAEILFEGTVGDAANVDSVVATLLYYAKDGTKIDSVWMGKIPGADLNGSAYTDTFNIPTDADISDVDTSMHMIQTRVYYAPGTHDGVHLTANATVQIIAAYQSDGIILDNLPEYNAGDPKYVQLKRGTTFPLSGLYGVDDLNLIGVRLIEYPSATIHIEKISSILLNGYYSDSLELASDLPISSGTDFYRIITYTVYGSGQNSYSVGCKVVDEYTADSIRLKDTVYVSIQQTATPTVNFYPELTDNKTLSWVSRDESVATVNATTGLVTGVMAGNAVLVATAASGVKDSCIVKVATYPVEGVELTPETVSVMVDEDKTLTANVLPSYASNKNVTFNSTDQTVAIVSTTGVVTGKKIGTAKIWVTTDDGSFKDTCTVTVTKNTGVQETQLPTGNVSIYPNPATNELNIAGLEQGTYELSIYNILGVRYMSSAIEVNGVYVLPIENLTAGTYILMLEGETGIVSKKLNIIE